MTARLALAAFLLSALAACGPHHPTGRTCRDGTHTAATGPGACSHHGGIA